MIPDNLALLPTQLDGCLNNSGTDLGTSSDQAVLYITPHMILNFSSSENSPIQTDQEHSTPISSPNQASALSPNYSVMSSPATTTSTNSSSSLSLQSLPDLDNLLPFAVLPQHALPSLNSTSLIATLVSLRTIAIVKLNPYPRRTSSDSQ